MRPPMNMTPEETEIWQRMEQHGEELVRDMGAALLQADRLPEWMKETAVNMLCDKLADARAFAASWMNDWGSRERETKMILEEYRARMAEELKKLDWQHPADKESSAYRLLSEASRDKQLSTQDWIALFEQYREGVKQQ